MTKVKPQLRVRADLMKQGHTVASWAKANGYKPYFVRQTLKRWAGKMGIPRGDKTRQVLSRLEATLGKPIYQKID